MDKRTADRMIQLIEAQVTRLENLMPSEDDSMQVHMRAQVRVLQAEIQKYRNAAE